MVNAANDAFLAGDPDSAVAWCEEALCDCRDPVLAADIKLILGRARTWLGDPHRSYDDLVAGGGHDPAAGQHPRR